MRLLNSWTFELVTHLEDSTRPPYAILSHRWCDDEVSFDNLSTDVLRGKWKGPGLDKIRGTCHIARHTGINWVWIDSCCINKNLAEEHGQSINKMFQWYGDAQVCYVYLSDVDISGRRPDPFSRCDGVGRVSEWFERGWTLQEMLTARELFLFDRNWSYMGDRQQLTPRISQITGIEPLLLVGPESVEGASIAQKMSWQCHRVTTQEEDIAYSMAGILGIFDLFPKYGEGRIVAFKRLQEKLLFSNPDDSLFAWAVPKGSMYGTQQIANHSSTWGLLAPWIDCFSRSGDITKAVDAATPRHEVGCQVVSGGYRIPMPIGDLYNENVGGGRLMDHATKLRYLHLIPADQVWYWYKQKRHDEQQRQPLHLRCYRKDRSLRYGLAGTKKLVSGCVATASL